MNSGFRIPLLSRCPVIRDYPLIGSGAVHVRRMGDRQIGRVTADNVDST